MAPSIFTEKDFARLFSDIHGYDHIFLDRIREWNWYALVYDNFEHEGTIAPTLSSSSMLQLIKPQLILTTTSSLYTCLLGTLSSLLTC